ncbi:MAG TPA: hypothetical protein VHW92_11620 [Mycobacteriales bacterium]|nr:hypothetical protein [Mycobacteriales bacterium]
MSSIHPIRRLAGIAAVSSAAVVAAVLPTGAGVAGAAPAQAHAHGHPAALIGAPLVLASHKQYSGYDVATDAAGNAYIGWIANSATNDSATRTVYLCTLRPGATSCLGGIQSVGSLGIASAEGLRVLATRAGHVTLIWYHQKAGTSPAVGEIAESTSNAGGPLTAPTDVASAPGEGELFDAELGPGGTIWTVAYAGLPATSVLVHPGLSAPAQSVKLPWSPGFAQLAFAGSKPIMSVEKDAAITTGPAYGSESGGHWSAFHALPGTWAVGHNADLTATARGVRLITSIGNASYRPVISKWTGSSFSRRALTADNSNCAPTSHDAYSDGSGRLVDVADECDTKLAIADFPNDSSAAIFRFSTMGLPADGEAQIASTARGIGFVAWTVEDGSTGDRLRVVRVRLPDRTTSVTKRSGKNRVTVTGPMSCLPIVSTPIHVTAHHAKGWTVGSKSLRLGKKKLHRSSLDGSTLTAGKLYKLTGSAVFHHGSHHKKLKAVLKFRSCPTG